MIKSRAAYLCNIKLFLIVSVVLGHSLEQIIAQDSLLYRIIYLFHMPLFAFVTGLHLKTVKSCLKQAKTALRLYLAIQGAVVLLYFIAGRSLSLFTPFWHLWYLLSLFWWALMAALCCVMLERFPRCKVILCFASIFISVMFGALPLGRVLSLSRTAVFFPYLLFGVLCPVKYQYGLKPKKRILMLGAGCGGVIPAWIVLQKTPFAFLYQADPYQRFQLSFAQGCRLRILCLLAACGIGLLLLALIPGRKLPTTKLGGDTLPAYLLHVLFLPTLSLFWPEGWNGLLPLFALGVVLMIWELGRWSRPLYTVLPKKLW